MRKRRGSGDLYRRLEALENDFDDDPVILFFRDGSHETLSNERLTLLLGGALHRESLSQADQRNLDSIGRCVRAVEPGGGLMVELIQAILHSPATPPE
jgi:hypothetical protein